MSLIHDALKSMDAPQQPASTPAARTPVAIIRSRPAWLDALLAFVAVVGAGMLGWYVWQSQIQLKLDSAPAAAGSMSALPQPTTAPPMVASGVLEPSQSAADVSAPAEGASPSSEVVAAVLPAQPLTSPAALNTPSNSTAPNATSSAVSLPSARVNRSEQPVVHRPAAGRRAHKARPVTPAVAAPASGPVVDDTPVELRFARFIAAMRSGKTAEAERELAVLKEKLPEGSLGLLRAQAWFDLRAGRDASAADMYRSILERIPGDEEAAINLASIQSRLNKHEEARSTLSDAARLRPDSAALRAALAQFTPNARQ